MPELEVLEQAGRAAGPDVERYLRQFSAAAPQRALEPSWLGDRRRAACEALARLGFPTVRDEEWRFTPTAPLASRAFARAGRSSLTRAALDGLLLAGPAVAELVFLNGFFAPGLSRLGSLPGGVDAESMSGASARRPASLELRLGRLALADRHPFTALNTALFDDGAVVTVAPGVVVDGVIHLVFVSDAPRDATVSHPRVLVHAGAHSQVQLVESYLGIGDQEYLTNAVSEITVDGGAVVDHYKVQRESRRAFHMGTLHVHCGPGSTFSSHSTSAGGAWVRNEASATLDGEGAECTLNGLYLADGRTLVDNHTTIDHAKPHCSSHETYKGILGGQARGVFNGKIVVRPDAQKTDAKQTNKALLLSDEAVINSKPQLEIFANDVKCTHGAAVGQLDKDAVFYLRARGIGEEDARNLLVHAFAGDVLAGMRLAPLRERLERVLSDDLRASLARQ